jgi:mono/diheme cytochrome c family protein
MVSLLAGAVLLLAAALAARSGDPAKGREIYAERCILCHGSQGEGWDWFKKAPPPIPVPDLAEVAPQRSDKYLFAVIKEGGEGVGRTKFMPPFGFELSDREVWDVVAYLRALSAKKGGAKR